MGRVSYKSYTRESVLLNRYLDDFNLQATEVTGLKCGWDFVHARSNAINERIEAMTDDELRELDNEVATWNESEVPERIQKQ